MLTAESSRFAHAIQNIELLTLSVVFLPLNTFILFLCYVARLFFSFNATTYRRNVRSKPYFQPRTVLVTGVGMTKGLSLARSFYAAGHNVIGADFEPPLLPTSCGNVSKSIRAFHKLAKPDGSKDGSVRYAQSLLNIIRREKVDLWVSCSGVASAVEDGQAKQTVELLTKCKAVQYDIATTQKLHEKHSFMEYTKSLGLTIPETYTITSKSTALKILEDAQDSGKQFILKYIGTDDSVRADMTLLPATTLAKTQAHVSRLQISQDRPWILQQFIDGPEYCTHSLVVRGEVKAFVACPSSELLMHYQALPVDSSLSMSMQRFTQEFAAAGGDSFTGHLSFDFLVDRKEAAAAQSDPSRAVTLYPIECNPRAHTAVCLFNETPEMVSKGYMSLLETPVKKLLDSEAEVQEKKHVNGATPTTPVYPTRPGKYSWVGHDLATMVILPFTSLFASSTRVSAAEFFDGCLLFLEHLIWWRDGTFEVWDPLPAWWLYHVSWPWQFLKALVTGSKWSRVNVSTMKVFGC